MVDELAVSGCLNTGPHVPHSLALELERSTAIGCGTLGGGVGVKDHGRRKERFGWLGGIRRAL